MTKKLIPCIHGGGESCKRQGGVGAAIHGADYLHPYPTLAEVGAPLGDPVEAVMKGSPRAISLGLDDYFDEDKSSEVLNLAINEAVTPSSLFKSMYDFDLESEEGVTRLMALLPVLDEEILKQVVQEIWPGYPVTEDFHPYMQRMHVKGYLLDYLSAQAE